MNVHLVDGTYELFRHHFALPSYVDADGLEVAATRGVLGSLVGLLEEGATHVGVATDHVVESFRNSLYEGYKTGEEMDPELGAQFPLLEEVLVAAGFAVFPMVEFEADDAMGSAAAVAAADPEVERVLLCTPDKDLAQCVVGDRVVQFDRRKGQLLDAAGVKAKFGVVPTSIPDYLGLMGDTSDGFPGLPGWGAKSASTVLARYLHLEDIPFDHSDWDVPVRGAATLAATLRERFDDALLFRRIATLAPEAPTITEVAELRWTGPTSSFGPLVERLSLARLGTRLETLAEQRA